MDRFGPPIAVLALALVYLAGPWFDTRGETAGVWTRRRWISLAAGVSVAYVFVDVLPELGARHLAFVKAPSRGHPAGPGFTIAMGAGSRGDVSHAPGLQWALVMQTHD